jgi:hypothetical protein
MSAEPTPIFDDLMVDTLRAQLDDEFLARLAEWGSIA